MRLDALVAWYQKKIGTYDKQQWEKTIEQKILAGLNHLPLKNTKLKTELIDVDLVRGSTFPKAKSKLSILKVLYLAALRCFLLPVYARWWVQQTSPGVFLLLLLLYLLQMLNLGIYSYRSRSVGTGQEAEQVEHIVTIADFLIPLALSLLLSVIHSQIVATASNNNNGGENGSSVFSCKALSRKCHSFVSPPATQTGSGSPISAPGLHTTVKRQREQRVRRKRRVRAHSETAQSSASKTPSEERSARKAFASVGGSKSATSSPARTAPKKGACSTSSSTSSEAAEKKQLVAASSRSKLALVDSPSQPAGTVHNESQEASVAGTRQVPQASGALKKNDEGKPVPSLHVTNSSEPVAASGRSEPANTPVPAKPSTDQAAEEIIHLPVGLRRRNVNWDPTVPERVQAGPSSMETVVDDDGFESLNGKSSGGEESTGHAFGKEKPFFQRKFPFTSDWIHGNGVVIDPKEHQQLSDSDTDTLKNSNTGHGSPIAGHTRSSADRALDQQMHRSLDQLHHIQAPPPEMVAQEAGSSLAVSGCYTNERQRLPESANRRPKDSSDECSLSSELDHSDTQNEHSDDEYELEDAPTIILNPSCGSTDRVSCTIWDAREAKKAEMSVLDISSAIIERVEGMPESCDYVYIGAVLSVVLSLVPAFCRLCEATVDSTNSTEVNFLHMPVILLEKASFSLLAILRFAFGNTAWERFVLLLSFSLRLILTFLVFFLLAVAERTFKQRFLYAKLFSHLTSSRRAQKSAIPHFRLNKVRNIKTWLCVRSYLKRRGPQNSVDVIVSAVFVITLLLLAFLSVEWLKDSVHLHSQFNLEALAWSCAFGTFLLRFMTLGTKINKKYKSVSVLITEQINLYVQIEQKPNKKEELMISNNVLKLAADLLKELESPFKISGLSANPYLYTTVKVVILSALSGVLSEMLGFKLKLHKIKIK
ncbi:putative homeodomain transcription factor [Anopheles albimanus]|uniref:putative homeodomain transcription factor n=1 Tax=Anopheles albimanus TaxID=7167 RepID=UPI00163E11E9|nr:putative homeodomain transcription factor [Anopheles albimanus]XP_035792539.1 putative homeodomain transcription factor [Anopheles albimanus]XP_035792540.1 putative homeodomain transcription factor [Anopheles albimanus]